MDISSMRYINIINVCKKRDKENITNIVNVFFNSTLYYITISLMKLCVFFPFYLAFKKFRSTGMKCI